jgi:hypothetical protein
MTEDQGSLGFVAERSVETAKHGFLLESVPSESGEK